MSSVTLDTEHGSINVTDTRLENGNPVLLLIHGNSSSSKIWRHIFTAEAITSQYRVISFDLPGHGVSSDAPNPEKSYWMRGYADLTLRILQDLKIRKVTVLGWSLGGHIGIELISLLQDSSIELKGLMIVGTPPVLGINQINEGFRSQDIHLGFAAQNVWEPGVAEEFAKTSAAAGKPELYESWMLDHGKRTDGRARKIMWARFLDVENGGVDQRKLVENTDVLIAVVNGADEPYVSLEYLDGIRWKSLWRGKCNRLEGLKHAPFWEEPKAFNVLLLEFLEDAKQ